MAKIVKVNYTPEQISTMTAMYSGQDNVAEVKAIADAISKNPNSVRAKLSSLGVYVKAEAVKSTATAKTTKAVKAAQIGEIIGANEVEREAISKTTNAVLDKLLTRLTNS
jgi:hypothetical protein